VFLLVVSAAIFVCCLSIMTATIRLCFGMARDDRLPASKPLAKVHPRLHTPILSCIAVGLLAGIPMIQYAGVAIIAIAATGMIYISYLLGNLAILRARLRGWPTEKTPFKLGGWGLIVNVLAIVWGGSMLVNFLWFGGSLRAFTNPPISSLPGIPNLGPFGSIPIFEATLGVIVLVGAIYYFVALRGSPETPQVLPASGAAA